MVSWMPVRAQHAADDLAEAAVAGDDDRRVGIVDLRPAGALRRARSTRGRTQRSSTMNSGGVSTIEIATAATSGLDEGLA